MQDQDMDGVFSALRSLLIVLGTALAGVGFTVQSPVYFWVMFLAGSITVIGPAVWGFYVAVTRALATRRKVAAGVGAGINLVLAQKALAADGSVISMTGAGGQATPPKPVTLESAQKIVADFAPVTPAKAT